MEKYQLEKGSWKAGDFSPYIDSVHFNEGYDTDVFNSLTLNYNKEGPKQFQEMNENSTEGIYKDFKSNLENEVSLSDSKIFIGGKQPSYYEAILN